MYTKLEPCAEQTQRLHPLENESNFHVQGTLDRQKRKDVQYYNIIAKEKATKDNEALH